jgi:hypothetical protein
VFRLPHDYAPLGFTQTTGRPALDGDNRNNINIVAVSEMFGRNAIRLILHDPARYAVNTVKAYRLFCQPTTRAIPHNDSVLFRIHDFVYSDILQGAAFGHTFTFWLLAFPVLAAAYVRAAIKHKLPFSIHAAAILIAYTLFVSCLAEYGENDRFKFAIEPLLWASVLYICFTPKTEATL